MNVGQRLTSLDERSRGLAAGAFALAVALLVRLLVLHQIDADPHLDHVGGDGLYYVRWAQQIAAGDWIGHEVFYPSPLYPYLVAILRTTIGSSLETLLVTQAIVGALGCGLLALATRRFFGPISGVIAGLLLAIYPAAISYDLQVDKTVLDPPLVAALLLCLPLKDSENERTQLRWFLVGAVLGVFSLTRENAMALIVPIAAWGFWAFNDSSKATRAKWGALLLCGLLCVVLPVCVRNSLIGGEFHLSTAKFGANFYYGNAAVADGVYFPLRPGRGDLLYEEADAREIAQEALGRRLSSGEVSSYWTRRTLADIRADPMRWIRLSISKLAMFFCDTEISDADVHDRHVVYSALLRALDSTWGFRSAFAAAIGAAAAILIGSSRRSNKRAVVVLLLALSATYAVAIAAFILFGRYRLPVVPMLIPLIGGGIVELIAALRARRFGIVIGSLAAAGAAVALVQIGEHQVPLRIRGTNEYNRAGYFAAAGRTRLAIDSYRRAIRENDRLEPAYVNLSLLLANSADPVEAVALARRAVQLDPNDHAAYTSLGIALAARSAWQEAIGAFTDALRLAPDSRAAQLDLAAAQLMAGNDAALLDLRRLATSQPSDEISRRAADLLARQHRTGS